jgi:hypothetical protein
MLNVALFIITLSIIMRSVVMVSVVAPFKLKLLKGQMLKYYHYY